METGLDGEGHEPGVSLSTVAKQMWSGINNTAIALTHGT